MHASLPCLAQSRLSQPPSSQHHATLPSPHPYRMAYYLKLLHQALGSDTCFWLLSAPLFYAISDDDSLVPGAACGDPDTSGMEHCFAPAVPWLW